MTLGKFEGRAVVGLDLDGVVCNYVEGFRTFLTEECGFESERLPEPSTYNLAKAGWPFRDVGEYLSYHRRAVKWGIYEKMPPVDGASHAISQLSEAGAHVRVVSHRLFMGGLHRRVVSDTATWLDLQGIPFMSLCFTGLKDSVGAHVYVEDSPGAIDTLRSKGIETFVFDQPYNRTVVGPRIMDWSSGAELVLEYLKGIGQL